MSAEDLRFIGELETIVQARLKNPTEKSYTAKLAAAGIKRIAQKVGEEGVELALAAVSGDRGEIIDEAADCVAGRPRYRPEGRCGTPRIASFARSVVVAESG